MLSPLPFSQYLTALKMAPFPVIFIWITPNLLCSSYVLQQYPGCLSLLWHLLAVNVGLLAHLSE